MDGSAYLPQPLGMHPSSYPLRGDPGQYGWIIIGIYVCFSGTHDDLPRDFVSKFSDKAAFSLGLFSSTVNGGWLVLFGFVRWVSWLIYWKPGDFAGCFWSVFPLKKLLGMGVQKQKKHTFPDE